MQPRTSITHLTPLVSTPLHQDVAPNLLAHREAARERAAWLVQRYGYNSTAYFALGQDKTFFFSHNGNALLSYVVQGKTALVLGDPIGPAEELPNVLEEFLVACHAQRLAVAFWQTREELSPLYRTHGLHALKIGEDAILDVRHFTLTGHHMSNVRTSTRRAEKAQLRVLFFHGTVADNYLREQMARLSRHWLARKGGFEMGFSMGRLGSDNDTKQITALALDTTNQVQAFLTLFPISGRNGWGLDLLRRAETTCPGTMELLLVRSIAHLQAQGAELLSLGLAPLSNQNQDRLPFLQRHGEAFVSRIDKVARYRTLACFKQKFRPAWENRYLVFSQKTRLPQIAIALSQVHTADQQHESGELLFA